MILNDENKRILLNSLNKEGFLLEDKVWKILEGVDFLGIERSKVIEHKGERVEIDFILKRGFQTFIGECKKTEYSWIFAKALERPNTLNLIYDSKEGMEIISKSTDFFKTAWTEIAVNLDSDGNIERNNNSELAKIPRNNIHEKVKQALKELEAYIYNNRDIGKFIIPIIITNSKLYYFDYTKSDINNNGDLINFQDLEEVNYLVYNFPEILRWDKGQQIVQSLSNSDHHIKTVFIVNINYLNEFLKEIDSRI
ncbi:MAG: hypothetical protein Q7R52_03650 [archaeon]|nr:hypothetical protein [archaeon]